MERRDSVKKHFGAKLYLAVILALMYLPVIVVALYSFNANTARIPNEFTGFSLQYYAKLFRDTRGLLAALKSSLILAGISCGASMVLGTLGALGMARRKFRLSGAVETVTILPVMIPEIILGVAFLTVFSAVGLKFGMGTLALAHITFCTPYVYMLVKSRLAGMDADIEAAARDLGASPSKAFFTVILPEILPGVLSGVALAFAMSLDDFVISFFVTGSNVNTLPIKIYSSVKTGVSLQVNALCTLMLAAAFVILGAFLFQPGRGKKEDIT
jgi:ABC-type spermidine/putrescine transport system, permease component II